MLDLTNRRDMSPRLVSLLQPNSPHSQRYQRLRLAVENLPRNNGGVVVAITSPGIGDGKTITAINLAGALAQNPARRVLLMDLDLRTSGVSIKDYLGARKWTPPGVVDSIATRNDNWQDLCEYIPAFNLYVLTSGNSTPTPYETLNSSQMGEVINEARRSFDYVVLDTTSVTLYPDCQLITKWVDKFIVLVRSEKTSRHQLEECLNLMSPDKVMGIVFNECRNASNERNGH